MEIKTKINYYIKKGAFDQAKKICKKILKKYPQDTYSLETIAYIYFNDQDYKESINVYKILTDQETNNINYLSKIAICNTKLKNYEQLSLDCEKILAIDSDNEYALASLGRLNSENSNYKLAIKYFSKVINNNPDHFMAAVNFSSLMFHSYETLEKKDYPLIEKTLNILYSNKRIAHENLTKISEKILLDKLLKEKLITIEENNFKINDILKLNDTLTHNILRKGILNSLIIEELLRKIRKNLLKNIVNKKLKNIQQDLEKILISIAIQCFNNEYIWYSDLEEEKLLEILQKEVRSKNSINDEDIKLYLYIIYCYSINSTKEIKQMIFKNKDVIDSFFYKIFIDNIEEEDAIETKIKYIGKIDDKTSKAIANQYEENPYPRWNSISHIEDKEFDKVINASISPNNVSIDNKDQIIDVLVAGCGTGKVAIAAAKLYKNSNIYAFDLSRASLAYASRKAIENDVNNIQFFQGDILEIKKIGKKFDIIECTGVLHHMNEPLKGLSSLLNVLNHDGYLRLSLYSTPARSFVNKIRMQIEDENIGLNRKDLINFRERMKTRFKKSNIVSSDFYSLSGFRDLFFNLKEHSFSQKELKSILKKFNLEFLGYYFKDPETKKRFINIFDDDPRCLNLDYWGIYEKDNLLTFQMTPSFWCRRISKK